MEKYKTASTYGYTDGDSYVIQIEYPDGSFGSPQEIDKEGHWGWDWWINTYDAEPIESFPEGIDLG